MILRKHPRRWGSEYKIATHKGAVWTLFGVPVFIIKRAIKS